MAEYASRDKQRASASVSSSHAQPEAREQTPTERADGAVGSAISYVPRVRSAIADVQAAVRANDPAAWRDARARVAQALDRAKKELARIGVHEAASSAKMRSRLAAAQNALATHERAAGTFTAAPTGWTPTPQDGEILTALAAPITGPIAAAFDSREAATLAVFAELTPAEARALHKRLAIGQDRHARYRDDLQDADARIRTTAEQSKISDPVVEAFAKLAAERRSKLLAFLADTRRRTAQRNAAAAARGVQNANSALPYTSAIQSSFGKHDIGPIRAQIGGVASEAGSALGAKAYATGSSIAFASSPDLHTAAHEAAHVVQQRAGIDLEGLDGGASDPLEQHADAVAERVVRGESAEDLLDAIPGSSGASTGAIQRKGADHAAAPAPKQDEGPATQKDPRSPWPVFEQSGKPYVIESTQDPVRFWIISDWIRHSKGFHANGNHATAPACAAEIMAALGWVHEDRIAYAAQHLVFDISKRKSEVQVAASAFYYMGLPSEKPVISRSSATMLQVASPLPNQDTPPGTSFEIDDEHRQRLVDALAHFTGLDPAPDAIERLRYDQRFQRAIAMSGVLQWSIDLGTGNAIFGVDPETGEKRYATWLQGQKTPKPDEQADAKLKLQNYYAMEIPGEVKPDRELVEADHWMWIDLKVAWPKSYPNERDWAVKPMVTPSYHGNGMASIVDCKWTIWREGCDPVEVTHTTTETAEVTLLPTLPKGVEAGTYNVKVEAKCDAYFAPHTFETTFEVKSTAAAMAQLASAKGASLETSNLTRTNETFDSSGSGDDDHGQRVTGDLPPGFVPSKRGIADTRVEGRVAE
ncbi:MAG TPA: DUF4157 domain-containing protein, partial [Kofleriaceae bacterium]